MSPPSTAHRFLLLLFFFLFWSIKLNDAAAADDDDDREISPKYCGPSTTSRSCKRNLNISYPFWRADDEGQICGYPGFSIDCSNADPDYPRIAISGGAFLVKRINYGDHSIALADADAITSGGDCPRPRQNLNFSGGTLPPFVYNYSIDVAIVFYANCTSPLDGGTPYPCSIDDERSSYWSVGPTLLGWRGNCEGALQTAVMGSSEGIGARLNGSSSSWAKAVNEGFVLNWDAKGENCTACERSEGRCGLETDSGDFFCVCNGTVTPHDCAASSQMDMAGSSVNLKIGLGVGGAALGVILMGASWFACQRRRRKKPYASSYFMSRSTPSDPSTSTMDLEKSGNYHGVHLFEYSELEEATDHFNPKHELGDGGFGSVYKGKLRDGRVIAVKRLYENNYKRVEQFMNEIEILQRLSHRNLVRLYGCTSRHCRELLLVYEYIPNGTIADHLHGEAANPESLSWATRLSIAIETASALVYLHASEVIHRDVKTSNILLDDAFRVKVADFGLSRLFPTHATHISTAPQGTPGYLDPEYHECYQLTSKSDVYSFGVVLIELISSLPAVDITRHRHEINLSNMAINKIQCNALPELVDKSLGFDSDERVREMICAVAELAFQCLQSAKEMRPSMEDVLESLLEIQGLEKKDSMASPTVAPLLVKNGSCKLPTLSPNSVILNAQWPSRSTSLSCNSC